MPDTVASDVKINQLIEGDFKALETLACEAVQNGVAPSIGLAIFQDDSPLLNAAWGWNDPETKTQPTMTNTLFDLADVTKLYVTIAFLSLVSEEKLYLHTPLVNHVPEFGTLTLRPIGAGQDPETEEAIPPLDEFVGQSVDPALVTCFQLLTHTSGLPAWRDIYRLAAAPLEAPNADPLSRSERWSRALDILYKMNFIAPPENGVIVSDIGFMLLGELVARADDTSGTLEDVIQARVLGDRFPHTTFNPLHRGFKREQIAPTENDEAWRERRLHGEVQDKNAHAVGGIAGHAGLFSTAMEVALLGNIWLNHSERMLRLDPELMGASVELQAQTGNKRRGLGWMLNVPTQSAVGDYLSSDSYGHIGYTGTSLWIDPDSKLSIALLTNRLYNGRDHDGIHALRREIHNIIGQALS